MVVESLGADSRKSCVFLRQKICGGFVALKFRGIAKVHSPPELTLQRNSLLANLLGQSRKTVYEWIAKGRLDGAFRKAAEDYLKYLETEDRASKTLVKYKGICESQTARYSSSLSSRRRLSGIPVSSFHLRTKLSTASVMTRCGA
jgi:hypothetical protein